MDIVYECCCGLDVHKKMIVACLRRVRGTQIREFGTTTSELREMAAWLEKEGCQMTAMESTGSYWKPIYNVLEEAGLDLMVVNPRTVKNIKGKKTDQNDASWISDLLKHGLLQPSFIPDKRMRELREAEQYLQSLKKERSAEVNRLQKTFEGCNLKISGTVTDVMGMSGHALLKEYLETGQLTAERIQEMREEKLVSNHLKATDEQIAKDFDGAVSPTQRMLLKKMLNHIHALDADIAEIKAYLEKQQTEEEKQATDAITSIPGVGAESARIIINILGPTLEQFDSPEKLAAWCGVAPGNNESAGKRYSGKTTPGNKLLKTTLVLCANAASRTKDTFLQAKFQRLKLRRGHKKALMALAHTILRSIWFLLREGVAYKELGGDYYDRHDRERKIKQSIRKLSHLGVPAELLVPLTEQLQSA